jgi:hypothetical protein
LEGGKGLHSVEEVLDYRLDSLPKRILPLLLAGGWFNKLIVEEEIIRDVPRPIQHSKRGVELEERQAGDFASELSDLLRCGFLVVLSKDVS